MNCKKKKQDNLINNLKHSQQVHLGQLFLDVNLITTFHEYDQDQAKGIACGRTKGHGNVKIFGDNATRKTQQHGALSNEGGKGVGGNIPWSFILQNYRDRSKIRPRGPHSLYAPLLFLNDNEITLPRQISRVS